MGPLAGARANHGSSGGHGSLSLYSIPTRALAVTAWVFCAFFASNLLLTGTAAAIWHFLPSLLVAAWALYVLLWRPRLLVTNDGLTVVNILREHRIPFSALKSIRVGQNVALETTDGRIGSWGAPSAGKLGPRREAGSRGIPGTPALSPTQAGIQRAWDAWEQREGDTLKPELTGVSGDGSAVAGLTFAVESRWSVAVAVVSLVLLLLCVASALT
ncbi:PH domain-containing protein [Arthrobacter cryoconiti]|uniref:PH domain-containing protein n=1 Tax=Arthrobacter cryoconiti TaxID=748907 RepID=A0ABV8R2X0_9MICC|nr:PH domain-containing protein [Arthrobacter cryoconiti]MCC9067810.1 PH domain-containing protein [Arthrobacter cryoconiti]